LSCAFSSFFAMPFVVVVAHGNDASHGSAFFPVVIYYVANTSRFVRFILASSIASIYTVTNVRKSIRVAMRMILFEAHFKIWKGQIFSPYTSEHCKFTHEFLEKKHFYISCKKGKFRCSNIIILVIFLCFCTCHIKYFFSRKLVCKHKMYMQKKLFRIFLRFKNYLFSGRFICTCIVVLWIN
jgi:hypothetical protein